MEVDVSKKRKKEPKKTSQAKPSYSETMRKKLNKRKSFKLGKK